MHWRCCDLLLSLAIFTFAFSFAALQSISPPLSYVATGGNFSLACQRDPQLPSQGTSVTWARGSPDALSTVPNEDDSLLVVSEFELHAGPFQPEEHVGSYFCIVASQTSDEVSHEETSVLSCPSIVSHALIETEFEVHPKDTTAYEGGTAVLQCSPPHSAPQAIISWTRDGETLDLTLPGTQFFLAPSGNLYILNVTTSDSGVYQCVATNPVTLTTRRSNMAALSIQATESLNVSETTPTFAVAPQNVTALAGSRVVLECSGRGYPAPRVTWARLEGGLAMEYQVEQIGWLVFEDVSAVTHAGRYVCKLLDPVTGELYESREVSLTVQVGPAFTATPPPEVLIHDSGTVTCSATASEPLQLYLLQNGTALESRSGLEVTIEHSLALPISPSPIHDTTSTTLVFQCLAINPIGCTNAVTMVTFVDSPIDPTTEVITTPTSNTALTPDETTPPILFSSGSGEFGITTPSPATPTTDHVTSSTDPMTTRAETQTTTDQPSTPTTASPPLVMPSNLSVTYNPTTDSIDVRWSYSSDDSLHVYFKLSWDSPDRITQSARGHTMQGPDASGTYLYQIPPTWRDNAPEGVLVVYVWAVNTPRGDGLFAQARVDTLAYTTPTPGLTTPTQEPTSTTVRECITEEVSPTSIQIALPDESILGRQSPVILYRCEQAASGLVSTPLSSPSPHILTSLLPNCSYFIVIYSEDDAKLAECRASTPVGEVDIEAEAERFQNGSILLTWLLPPEIRQSNNLTIEVNWGRGWVHVTPGLHSPAHLEPNQEYTVRFRLRLGKWEGVANVTIPRAPEVVEKGESATELAVLYSVIFLSVVMICSVMLAVVLGLKYIQGEHRDADKVTDFREKSREKFERMSFPRASIKSKSTEV